MRVEIERIAFGGKGIARQDGKVLFVRGGLPGDLLDIKIIKDKGSYAEAVIEEIAAPSEDRIDPPCPVFHLCGGCQFQNFKYSGQLVEKENILRETIERIGGFHGVEVDAIFPSPGEYEYRTRVQLSTWFYSGEWHAGFYQEGTQRKVKVESCPISDRKINGAINRISQVLASIGDPHFPLEKVHISSNGLNAYIALVPRHSRKPDSLVALVKHLKRHEETENVSVVGKGEIEFEFGTKEWKFLTSPSVFTQSNPPVNEAMIETVLEWAELSGQETVLDLYSGIGNFSIPCAQYAEKVVGVEINKKAVGFARRNAALNGIKNMEFHSAPCEEFVGTLASNGEKFELAVIDPPREGAREIIKPVAELVPDKIIYVSCDPSTLARDLKGFHGLGYTLEKVRPFDMFPQTYHIESISLLKKA